MTQRFLAVAAEADVLLELGAHPLTSLTVCRLYFLFGQMLAVTSSEKTRGNESSSRQNLVAGRCSLGICSNVGAAMVAGALRASTARRPCLDSDFVHQCVLAQLGFGEARQSAPRWKLRGGDGYEARSVLTYVLPIARVQCVGPCTQSSII